MTGILIRGQPTYEECTQLWDIGIYVKGRIPKGSKCMALRLTSGYEDYGQIVLCKVGMRTYKNHGVF